MPFFASFGGNNNELSQELLNLPMRMVDNQTQLQMLQSILQNFVEAY